MNDYKKDILSVISLLIFIFLFIYGTVKLEDFYNTNACIELGYINHLNLNNQHLCGTNNNTYHTVIMRCGPFECVATEVKLYSYGES